MSLQRPRFRFAPTPSGYLHPGNWAHIALTAAWCHKLNGQLLLRIDDLDTERARPEYVEDIFRLLDWLKIVPDEGPSDPTDLAQNWSQSIRLSRYDDTLNKLVASGAPVYACSRSRTQTREQKDKNESRSQDLQLDNEQVTWRLACDNEVRTITDFDQNQHQIQLYQSLGDPILRQRDRRAAYQIASLTDDLDFGITHIIRGTDLLPSTALQCLLAEQLGWTNFAQINWLHHPLIAHQSGQKWSKSAGHLSQSAVGSVAIESVWSQAAALIGREYNGKGGIEGVFEL
jgi:glutamyl/glutaminyl-tRNA synthetase